jgi:hypothetical protein
MDAWQRLKRLTPPANSMPDTEPKPKKQRVEKQDKPDKPDKAEKPPPKARGKTDQPKPKRGPARPHRRLPVDVIESRITKLQKRLERAKSQIEDAGRHVEGYLRERDFRAKEADPKADPKAEPKAEPKADWHPPTVAPA